MSIASRTTWDEIPHFRLVSSGDEIHFISLCKLGIKKVSAGVRRRFQMRYRSGSDMMNSLDQHERNLHQPRNRPSEFRLSTLPGFGSTNRQHGICLSQTCFERFALGSRRLSVA
jgi:hypothetical protein